MSLQCSHREKSGEAQLKAPVMLVQDWRDVDGVVAGKACDRRAKYLFAHVTGAPALKASFLERWAPALQCKAYLTL